MDYGVLLKRRGTNPGRRSAHHVRQTPFRGSNRELRSAILKAILAGEQTSEAGLAAALGKDSTQVRKNLRDLEREGFIVLEGDRYLISEGTKGTTGTEESRRDG